MKQSALFYTLPKLLLLLLVAAMLMPTLIGAASGLVVLLLGYVCGYMERRRDHADELALMRRQLQISCEATATVAMVLRKVVR